MVNARQALRCVGTDTFGVYKWWQWNAELIFVCLFVCLFVRVLGRFDSALNSSTVEFTLVCSLGQGDNDHMLVFLGNRRNLPARPPEGSS